MAKKVEKKIAVQNRAASTGRLVGDIEREYGVRLGMPPETRLSTYLSGEGLPSLATALDQASARFE